MKLSLLFKKDKEIILSNEDEEECYRGNINQVIHRIKNINKEYVNNNCFITVKDKLIKTVNAIIKDILQTADEDQADIYDFLKDTRDITKEIEQKIPCVAVAAYLDESNYKLYLTIIPKSNKTNENIFKIILTVNTENEIEFEMTTGKIEFNATKLVNL